MEPNFFIVGAAKAATTNISYYLNLHPKVFVSKLNEPYYFCKWDVPQNFRRESMIKDEKTYLKLFQDANSHLAIGEATPSYLHSPNAASKIKERFPESKIIITIRNPIVRAQSSYFSNEFMRKDNQTFFDMIKSHEKLIQKNKFDIYNILEPGFYSKHIERFQHFFGSDKIKIIIFEEYIKDVENSINSLLTFLGLDNNYDFVEQTKNSYRIPKNKFFKLTLENKFIRKIATSLIPTLTREKIGDKFLLKETNKPKINSNDRNYLKNFYKDEINNLESLLERNLPWSDFYE